VANDLSSGRLENLTPHVDAGRVDFRRVDLLEQVATRDAVRDVEVVFRLAADHGARGYVDLHPA
jgi:nucleoside-diphosphate-sugar epimerase